jgi:hypothetical protein
MFCLDNTSTSVVGVECNVDLCTLLWLWLDVVLVCMLS